MVARRWRNRRIVENSGCVNLVSPSKFHISHAVYVVTKYGQFIFFKWHQITHCQENLLTSHHLNVLFLQDGDFSLSFSELGRWGFQCHPGLCCLLRALRFGSHCLYKLKAVLNVVPAWLMRGSLQTLCQMMLSNWWHKTLPVIPLLQTLGVNMPAPPFLQRSLAVQTACFPPSTPHTHSDNSAIFSGISGCLRPMTQPGTSLMISFICVVATTPLSACLFFFVSVDPNLFRSHVFVPPGMSGVMLSLIFALWIGASH